jgi:hypothetical protein
MSMEARLKRLGLDKDMPKEKLIEELKKKAAPDKPKPPPKK